MTTAHIGDARTAGSPSLLGLLTGLGMAALGLVAPRRRGGSQLR